jgi:ribonuclease P protein component
MIHILTKIDKVKNFKEIFENGKKFKTLSSQIVLFLQPLQEEESKISYGVLALKKIVGKKAVCRNKAKRRFRNGLLASLKIFEIENGYHIKIVALTNKNTITSPWPQVLKDIEKHLKFIHEEIRKSKENMNEQKINAE